MGQVGTCFVISSSEWNDASFGNHGAVFTISASDSFSRKYWCFKDSGEAFLIWSRHQHTLHPTLPVALLVAVDFFKGIQAWDFLLMRSIKNMVSRYNYVTIISGIRSLAVAHFLHVTVRVTHFNAPTVQLTGWDSGTVLTVSDCRLLLLQEACVIYSCGWLTLPCAISLLRFRVTQGC